MTNDPPQDSAAADRADARAKRIAAAVERGRREYLPEHGYTERKWFLESDVAGPSKLDRQRVEYASTSRITRESKDARRALDDILVCAGSKPLSTLPRELVATAARACILAEDKVMAVQVARAGRKHWKQSVGLAVVSAQALEFAGEIKEATHPLFAATSSGIHYPVITYLADLLDRIAPETSEAGQLASILYPLASSRSWAFDRPLFSDERARASGPPPGADALRITLASLDRKALKDGLGVEGNILGAALLRIGRALGGGEEEPEVPEGERVERGVREL